MNNSVRCWIGLCVTAIVFWTSPAQAMHISDGILPLNWAAIWFAASAPLLFWGLRTIECRRAEDPRTTALVALVGSAIFVVSCMPVPIPWLGTCSHACGTGLGAVLIGPGPTIVVASIALLLQALFLAHGGLTTLGADVFSMGVMGALSACFAFRGLRALRVPVFAAAFAAGLLSDWATYATTAFQLAAALPHDPSFGAMFTTIALAFAPTQIPLGIAEGVLTAVAYRFVLVRRPELLALACRLPSMAGVKA